MKENIPAFPRPIGHAPHVNCTYSDSQSGMTLRDYFAGQVLVGLCSKPFDAETKYYSDYAEIAYKFADAMIKERENEFVVQEVLTEEAKQVINGYFVKADELLKLPRDQFPALIDGLYKLREQMQKDITQEVKP